MVKYNLREIMVGLENLSEVFYQLCRGPSPRMDQRESGTDQRAADRGRESGGGDHRGDQHLVRVEAKGLRGYARQQGAFRL